MTVFVIRRLSQSVFVVLLMSLIVFFGVFAIGNPVDILIAPDATQAERAEAIVTLGLDKPLWEQYFVFLGNAAQGNLGKSFVFNEPALTLILHRLPATMELAFVALVFTIIVGIPLGLWAGMKPYALSSKAFMAGSILGFSIPHFWQGLVLVMIFSVYLGWLPASGRGETGEILGITTSLATWDGIQHLLLPAFNLAVFKCALIMRLTRAGAREVLLQDYIKFARAKGLSNHRIIFVHALSNIMIPIVTVLGMEFGRVIAFAIITESIFAWPGMGKLVIESINMLDRPVIVAYLMTIVMLFIVINLIVDLLYSVLDPRVRLQDMEQ
jgi:peptide/nickel transport system permease protein